jgi:hypothetical protein
MGYVGVKPSAVPLTSADIADSIITSAKIVDGTIVNADINASAGIASTKLSGITSEVKAWVNFDGTGTPAIRASLNVSSITDNNTGDYTINFTTAISDANYAVGVASQSPNGSIHQILAGNANSAGSIVTSNQTAAAIRIIGWTTTFADSAYVHISIFR